MKRLATLVTLCSIVLSSLFVALPAPAAAAIQAAVCTQPGQGAPTAQIAQRFRDAYNEAASVIGTTDPGPNGCVHQWGNAWTQDFLRGSERTNLMYQPAQDRVWRLYSDWLRKYFNNGHGGPGVYGAPLDNPHAAGPAGSVEQYFRGGAVGQAGFFRQRDGAPVRIVQGAILDAYRSVGGTSGYLGAPTSDEYGHNGAARSDFVNGSIEYRDGRALIMATGPSNPHQAPSQPKPVFTDVQVYSRPPLTVTAGDRVGAVVVARYEGGAGNIPCGLINLGKIGDGSIPFHDGSTGAWRSHNRAAAVGCIGELRPGQQARWDLPFSVPANAPLGITETGPFAPVYDGVAWSSLSISVSLRVIAPAPPPPSGRPVFDQVQVYSSPVLDVTAGDRVKATVVARYVGGAGNIPCGQMNLGRVGDQPARFRDDAAGWWDRSTWRNPARVAAVGCIGELRPGQQVRWDLGFSVPADTVPNIYETGPYAPVYDGVAWSEQSISVRLRISERNKVVVWIDGTGANLDGANTTKDQIKSNLQQNGLAVPVLTFSYTGGTLENARPFSCSDTLGDIDPHIRRLQFMLLDYSKAHPKTDFVLAGYSQGGMIAWAATTSQFNLRGLLKEQNSRISRVLLFGTMLGINHRVSGDNDKIDGLASWVLNGGCPNRGTADASVLVDSIHDLDVFGSPEENIATADKLFNEGTRVWSFMSDNAGEYFQRHHGLGVWGGNSAYLQRCDLGAHTQGYIKKPGAPGADAIYAVIPAFIRSGLWQPVC